MITFHASFIETWKTRGYRFILVLPREKYGILRPLAYDKPLNKGFTIQLSEIGLLQITDNYFFTMDKDVHVKATWQQLRK
jgi:hypothetical protein